MGKILCAALLGVVIGAAVSEFIHKEKPELIGNLGDKLKRSANALKNAFKEGYAQTAKPANPSPAV